MGLCSSKSTVSLAPGACTPSAEAASRAVGASRGGTPAWEDRSPITHVTKVNVESVGPNPPAKGYLELGEGLPQASREAEEEEEDTEAEELEELLQFSDCEGSLKSEFLE